MVVALSIAGFDPTCGAGVVADVKTFAALDCYGLAVPTAITVQNTMGVRSVSPLSPELVTDQLQALFDDISIDAVKIGMLATSEIVLAVADFLARNRPRYIVLDTPLYSSSGHSLIAAEAINIVCEKLFPLATVITPNLAEAGALSKFRAYDLETIKMAAERLYNKGAAAVLVKGGHLEGEPIDLLYDGDKYHTFSGARIKNVEAHGTGCALSSAIAALLARGNTLKESVEGAKKFVARAMTNPQQLGNGAGLLNHLG
jgi:hydroxymethylpyrimidine/phosphomethylpyrimidine kinase